MDAREFKGLELAARSAIKWAGKFWLVPSQSHKGSYKVNHDATDCTCDDFELHATCKHLFAVRFVRERDRTPAPLRTPLTADPAARPKKPTYRQDWPAYNAAQTREKELFLPLLADLCSTVPDRQPKATGRPRVRERDAIFSAAYKVYSGFSGRRFSTDLRDAEAAGHVERAPHYNSVFRVLEDPAVTPTLHALTARSALPLRAVERDFAVDSSGFASSKFARWFDTKHGVERVRAEGSSAT